MSMQTYQQIRWLSIKMITASNKTYNIHWKVNEFKNWCTICEWPLLPPHSTSFWVHFECYPLALFSKWNWHGKLHPMCIHVVIFRNTELNLWSPNTEVLQNGFEDSEVVLVCVHPISIHTDVGRMEAGINTENHNDQKMSLDNYVICSVK